MNYSEVLETRGNWRVRLVLDKYAPEPYDDGQSPLMRLDRHGYGVKAGHVMATGRSLDDDDRIEYAVQHWCTTPADSDWRLFEKYLRAYYGVTRIETWHSGSYWYVTYDPARWRAHTGAPEGSVDMSEYRAWCEGEVYGWVLEKRVHWHTDDPDFEDKYDWEATSSCWGFYGRDYAKERALEELADAALDLQDPDVRQAAYRDGRALASGGHSAADPVCSRPGGQFVNTPGKARENKARRAAVRQHLRLAKTRRRDPRAVGYNRWYVLDGPKVVFGNPDGATLEQVERWLAGEGR